ncbi:MAG: 50S ribosomal protein L22 [Candidatus Hydrogenedentota bacterium]
MTDFSATARFQRISPRRVRMVGDLIKGKNVLVALDILAGTKKAGAELLLKVIKSARANAIEMDKQKNLRINPDRFVVTELLVDGGPMMKRFRPMSMGRAGRIRRRTTHVRVTLAEKSATKGKE